MTTGISRLTLHFVRHGETAWNAERRFQTPEVTLSETGREQARVIAETLAGSTKPELILASDYARAAETAAIIAERLRIPVVREPALRERNFGVVRGRLYSELESEISAMWGAWDHEIDEGESWADVFVRLAAFFERLRSAPPAAELILVTHGGTMNIALHALAGGVPSGEFKLNRLENCAVRTVEIALTQP